MQHVFTLCIWQMLLSATHGSIKVNILSVLCIQTHDYNSTMLSWFYAMNCMLSSNQWKALYHFVMLLCYWESAPITALLPTLCEYKGFFTVSDWTGVKVKEIKDGRVLLPRLYLSALITDIRRLCPSEQGDREKRMLESQRETEEVKEWNIPERGAAVW